MQVCRRSGTASSYVCESLGKQSETEGKTNEEDQVESESEAREGWRVLLYARVCCGAAGLVVEADLCQRASRLHAAAPHFSEVASVGDLRTHRIPMDLCIPLSPSLA